eukprot:SAG22_NODE_1477_length_4328_cov_2.451643_7_plen_139_part_00
MVRSDSNIRMFFSICDFCALGSGATNNIAKSMVQLIGVDRARTEWPLIDELGATWVKDGEALEVTGLQAGYSRDLRATVWVTKIQRGVRNLRSWMSVPGLARADRALVFRTYAMSVCVGVHRRSTRSRRWKLCDGVFF